MPRLKLILNGFLLYFYIVFGIINYYFILALTIVKILAIDDDFIVLATLTGLVKNYFGSLELDTTLISSKETVSVDCAPSIEAAHAFLEVSLDTNSHYDIIFLDLSIDTKDDGFALIPVIKSMFKNIFIVVVSGNQDMKTVLAVDALGVSGYIKKPITTQSKRITQVIDRVIHFKKIAREMGYSK